MAFSTDDSIFFVFDNNRVQDEYDFVQDGILYFSSFANENPEKYGLVSQLVGISRFLQTMFESPASVFCLRDVKIAFRHVESYTLGLSGKVHCPSGHLLDLLNRLVDMFRFYRGGFRILEKVCSETGKDFLEELQISWDCFTAFVKRYGDMVSSSFQNLPILRVAKEIELEIFMRSAHLLEDVCRMVPGAKSGCFLYANQVCYTQLTPDLTSRLTVVRPKQQNLPCQLLPTDLELQGVRRFKVYLTQDEVLTLGSGARHVPSVQSFDSAFSRKPGRAAESASNIGRASPAELGCNGTTPEFNVNGDSNCVADRDSGHGDAFEVGVTGDGAGETERESERLVEMELFVQGTSDSVCILLMEGGSFSDVRVLKRAWQQILLCISEVERLIRGTACDSKNDAEPVKTRDELCRHLTFNGATGDLSGNLLQPVTSPEHSFCQAVQTMHEAFRVDADTMEVTLRTHQSVFTGIQNGFDESFCWSTGFPPKSGATSVIADDNTEKLIRKLRDIKLSSS